MIMKQEPLCPSRNVLDFSLLCSKKILVSSEYSRSIKIKIICSVAVITNITVFILMFLCLHVKKEIIPFSSNVEVQFQEEIKPVSALDPIRANNDQANVPNPIAEPLINSLPDIQSLPKITSEDQKILNNTLIQQKKINSLSKTIQSSKQTGITRPNQLLLKPSISHNFPMQRCSLPQGSYPFAARKRHEQGIAKIALQILSNGQIKQVKVVETSGFDDLDQAAVEAVQQIKCKVVDNIPLLQTTTSVHFQLKHH